MSSIGKQGISQSANAVDALEWQIKNLAKHLPWPVREYRFHEERKWRFDLCWPAIQFRVAVEIDGGIWRKGGGAHTGRGHIRDIRKGNDAILLGYRVLHFIPEDVLDGDRTITTALDTIVKLFQTLGVRKT